MKKLLLTVLLLGLILMLAACGGDDSTNSNNNTSGGDGTTLDLKASNWKFDQDTYTVPAGNVTVNLVNDEGFHGIDIEGTDISIEGENSATSNLEPGEYTIRCNIPCGEGHGEMTAQLIVE